MNSEKAQRMFALIDQWRASGIRHHEFCRQHQIKVSTFSYWITRKNRADKELPGGFVRIESAGSHNAARRSGMIYTMMGNCKIHKVNPYNWLHYVLQHILDTRYEDVRSLYPQNFKSRM